MTALDTKALLEGVTPGPWDAHEGCVWGAGNPELSGTYRFGTPILRPDTLYRRWGRDVDHEEREANLRLAASAPRLARRVIELEEALKLARAAAEHFNVRLSPNELAQVDAALKGEG